MIYKRGDFMVKDGEVIVHREKKNTCLSHMHTIHDIPCYYFKYLDPEERAELETKRQELISSYNLQLTHSLIELFEEYSPLITDKYNKENLIKQIESLRDKAPESEYVMGSYSFKVKDLPLNFDLQNMSLNELWSIYTAINQKTMFYSKPKQTEENK